MQILFHSLAGLSIVVYLILAAVGFAASRSSFAGADLVEGIYLASQMFIFVPGLPVVIVAIYFFAWSIPTKLRMVGIGIVVLFVFVHFIVSGIAAHSDKSIHLPLQILELGLAGVIVLAAHNFQTRARPPTKAGDT